MSDDVAERPMEPEEWRAYDDALREEIAAPSVKVLLGRRGRADGEAVLQVMRHPEWIAFVRSGYRESDAYREFADAKALLAENQEEIDSLRPRAALDLPRGVLYGGAAVLCVVLLAGWGRPWFPLSVFLLVLSALARCLTDRETRLRLRASLELARARTRKVGSTWMLRRRAADLREPVAGAVRKGMRQAALRLIGEDAECLLVATDHQGIRTPRDVIYVVHNRAMEEITRKLDALVDGTIAVCGPRGSGKSTLLERCSAEKSLRIAVQAPASYVPLEFLTSLFVTTCQTYMKRNGARYPEFRRLSPLRTALRRVVEAVRRNAWRVTGGLLAMGLVALGVWAGARDLVDDYRDTVVRRGRDGTERLGDAVTGVLEGRWPWIALAVTVLGYLVWEYAGRWRPGDAPAVVKAWILRPVGRVVTTVALTSAWWPGEMMRWFDAQRHENPTEFWVVLASVASTIAVAVWEETKFSPGLVTLALLVGAFLADPVHEVAYGWSFAQRVAVLVLGVLVTRVSWWTGRRREPRLVTRCRDQLYRLQTVQSVPYGATGTAGGGLGSSYGTSFTASPFTLPELVEQLRAMLADIAEDRRKEEERVVVTIDEIDRLGTTQQALTFLGEIKAVLGVPGVHFLISVSEDVGASFVRRGLTGRDVTDSTFDEVVHVRPCTLNESWVILTRRVEGITGPFVALVHALGGGVPRDLIRYARELIALRGDDKLVELVDLADRLVMREMRDTVDGLRSALREGGAEGVFDSLRRLSEALDGDCGCHLDARKRQIARFAAWADAPGAADAREHLPSAARERLDEATAHAYFCVTLLDVFAEPHFTRRRLEAQGHGPNGHPGRFALVREELSFSPQGARAVLDAIRPAWSLSPLPPPDGRDLIEEVDLSCEHRVART